MEKKHLLCLEENKRTHLMQAKKQGERQALALHKRTYDPDTRFEDIGYREYIELDLVEHQSEKLNQNSK